MSSGSEMSNEEVPDITTLEDSSTAYESLDDQDSTIMKGSSTPYESADDSFRNPDVSSEYCPDTSFDSSSSSPPPQRPTQPRRSARNVNPPSMLTYDKIGTPVISKRR